MMKIILVGYMGSGKSTVGKNLAQKLKIPFFDLDVIIEESENASIKDIFDEKGEIYFRKLEHKLLHDFVKNNDTYVLSLGGGTPCYANNHLLLQESQINSVYLKTSISEIVRRIKSSKTVRPLILNKTQEELKEFVAKHLFDRSYFYHQSKVIVLTDGKITDEVVDDIILKLA